MSLSDSLISLVITTFNRGPRIAETLDSVLCQTVLPEEVIVVDDCSTDGTADWVSSRYPDIRVICTPRNLHTSGARNFGGRNATGDILVFLDHDDWLLPHAVETLLQLLKEFPEARAVHADHAYCNTASGVHFPDHHSSQPAFHRLQKVLVHRCSSAGRLFGKELYYALLHGNLLQQPWGIYRDTFLQLGGFSEDIKYCEDWDLYLRVTRDHPVALSDRLISHHIIEGDNLHLSTNQAVMHRKVIENRLREESFYHLRARWILKRRLAMYFKKNGDDARPKNLGLAWRNYWRSFKNWPFDVVVAGRTCGWPIRMLFGLK